MHIELTIDDFVVKRCRWSHPTQKFRQITILRDRAQKLIFNQNTDFSIALYQSRIIKLSFILYNSICLLEK